MRVRHDGAGRIEAGRGNGSVLTMREVGAALRADPGCHAGPADRRDALDAVLERFFADPAGPSELTLDLSADPRLTDGLAARAGAAETDARLWLVRAAQFFQDPAPWTAGGPAFPLHHAFTGGQRHPVRPAKPTGTVYARWIPWLRRTLTFRTLHLQDDLPVFHRWMNDPRVDHFWGEAGDLDKHRAYLAALAADPHMLPLLGCIDGRPFSYFEVYWARENRLGPYYDAADHDRGWHVVVGEDSCRGRAWVTAWLPSLMHYIFLDDPRTPRIVGEPRADHDGQLRNLDHAGFARIKHVKLPHKRAVLVRLERERFFADRLWAPSQASEPASAPLSP